MISENDYEIVNTEKIDEKGTYIITVKDNNELWIVSYTGEKLVRLYDNFSDSYLLKKLIRISEYNSFIPSTRYYYQEREGINYLTAKVIKDNYLKFTDKENKIAIEVEIDETQIESDTAFLNY